MNAKTTMSWSYKGFPLHLTAELDTHPEDTERDRIWASLEALYPETTVEDKFRLEAVASSNGTVTAIIHGLDRDIVAFVSTTTVQ